MNNVLFYIGGVSVTVPFLIRLFSVLCSLFFLLALRSARGESLRPVLLTAALSLLPCLLLSRGLHWYCNPDQYRSLRDFLNPACGGWAVPGTVIGVLLTALVLALRGHIRRPAAFFDSLVLAGLPGLALGKTACAFSTACRGKYTVTAALFQRWPFAEADGRLATWSLETVVYLILFLAFLPGALRRKGSGRRFMLLLSYFCALQVVLDSTRYDALYLRSNGFVSLTQILCVCAVTGIFVLFSVRCVRKTGVTPRVVLVLVLFAAAAGTGGYMEYFVQRYGNRWLFAYAVQGLCFLLTAVLTHLLCRQDSRRLLSTTDSQ